MSGAEIANLKARWSGGALIIEDLSGNAVLTINPSTGGISLGNAGGLTISTGILSGLNVSSGISVNGDLTISSGRLAYNGQVTLSVTTAATLTATGSGILHLVTASDTVVTLPGAGSSGKALCYTILSSLTTAGQVVIKTTTTEVIVGGVGSTGGVSMLSNTAGTHSKGDYVVLINQPASTSWALVGMVGTWASTT